MTNETLPNVGDVISIPTYICGHRSGEEEFVVELFRGALGVFQTHEDRRAGCFTPLCRLYVPGPESKSDYIPNWGAYDTNMVPAWTLVKEGKS